MMGAAPAQVLGQRVGRKLKSRRKKKFNLGRVVGRALVELRRGDNWEDWQDPKKVFGTVGSPDSGLAGKVVKNASRGGRIVKDIIDARAESRAARAEFGPFTVKANSPNTIRVTAGPTRRNRRQKREWEKVGTQRELWKWGGGAAVLGTGALVKYAVKQHPSGSIVKGLGVIARRAQAKGANVVEGVKAGLSGREARMRVIHPQDDIQKKADEVYEKKIKRQGPEALKRKL